MPPAERVVAFVFSHEEFRARPPAPFYRLAGPATWDACSIDREAARTIVTRVSKAKGRREYGVAARGRAAKPDMRGQSSLCATGLFSVLRGFFPYKPHVGAFVGEDVSDMWIAYRDMSDTAGFLADHGRSATMRKYERRISSTMNEITPETFDPSCWNFRKLKDFEYPGGVLVYEYDNHPVVDGAPDFLRLNLYLSKDGDYVTIWFGLLDPLFAELRLGPVQTPANFSFEEYDEVLFRGISLRRGRQVHLECASS